MAFVALVALAWSPIGLVGVSTAAPAATELVGTFSLEAGRCDGGVTGSYFRMILPTGGSNGPFVTNSDSSCADKEYTPLAPGSDGGLIAGSHQPAPSPGFDGSGNSLAGRVTRPARFFGVDFSTSTEPTDLQTGVATAPPTISSDGAGGLSGDLRSFGATWNRQAFNQGAPKPDGSVPGNTGGPTGTYDQATGRFVLTWTSQIVGGPFNNFTGLWHFEGTFTSSGAGSAAPAAPAAPAAGSPGAGSSSDPAASAPAAGATSSPGVTAPVGDSPAATETTSTPLGERAASGVPAGASAGAGSAGDPGWQAPTWLVVLTAALGVGAVIVLLVLDRRGRPAVEA